MLKEILEKKMLLYEVLVNKDILAFGFKYKNKVKYENTFLSKKDNLNYNELAYSYSYTFIGESGKNPSDYTVLEKEIQIKKIKRYFSIKKSCRLLGDACGDVWVIVDFWKGV